MNESTLTRSLSTAQSVKKFSQAARLKTYERILPDKKAFNCSKCEKKFSQAAHLKTHEEIRSD